MDDNTKIALLNIVSALEFLIKAIQSTDRDIKILNSKINNLELTKANIDIMNRPMTI